MKAHIMGLLLILCSLPSIKVHAQPLNFYKRNYLYSYDATGNRIQRKYILLECPACRTARKDTVNAVVADSLYILAIKDPLVLPSTQTEKLIADGSVQLKNVFPNPTKGNVLLQFTGPVNDARLHVMDLLGNKMDELVLNGSEWQFDLSLFPAGSYLFYIRMSNGSTFIKKIVKL